MTKSLQKHIGYFILGFTAWIVGIENLPQDMIANWVYIYLGIAIFFCMKSMKHMGIYSTEKKYKVGEFAPKTTDNGIKTLDR